MDTQLAAAILGVVIAGKNIPGGEEDKGLIAAISRAQRH
jgi:hypothetical protein